MPKEAESYVHRIGRTARAGMDGIALSLCDAGEISYLRKIELEIRCSLNIDQNHPFHAQSIASKKTGVRKFGSKNFSDGRGRGSRNKLTTRSEGKNKNFSFSRNRLSGKPVNGKKNIRNKRTS